MVICQLVKCQSDKCQLVKCQLVKCQLVKCQSDKYQLDKCQSAKCQSAKWFSTKRRGAIQINFPGAAGNSPPLRSTANSRCQSNKTFYGRNLQMFVISYSVFPRQAPPVLSNVLSLRSGAYLGAEYLKGALPG